MAIKRKGGNRNKTEDSHGNVLVIPNTQKKEGRPTAFHAALAETNGGKVI